jgi:hypothetical protein
MAKNVKGLDAIARRMAAVKRAAFDALDQQLQDEAKQVLARSRDLAPQLTGRMIATAHVEAQRSRGANLIRAQVVYREPYALFQHEGFYWPGPISSQKLGPTFAIGRKFLTRAVDERREAVLENSGRAVEGALRVTLR